MLSYAKLSAQPIVPRPLNWASRVEICHLKNFYKLNDSIYRSEQPDEVDFVCLGRFGIKSVLNLRSHHLDSCLLDGTTIKPFTVKMVANNFTDNEIIQSLRILRNGPKPIVVHCLHGSDRTGVVIAMYRIIFENWTREQALDELQNGGYGFHKQYTNINRYINNADLDIIKRSLLN
jgi:protein tyrosine/serine phosphatase